ncbi:hypothetical protein CDAR_555141 [Caerostris darwini]|uniref:Uncharacterized protein n=1 Tax=Caerostris darwini TaxID=1538125 RepID=A0AAV4RKU3_9ARAC|nr:hypothetical protein CDAR_555141 [Caerostris darwini]
MIVLKREAMAATAVLSRGYLKTAVKWCRRVTQRKSFEERISKNDGGSARLIRSPGVYKQWYECNELREY